MSIPRIFTKHRHVLYRLSKYRTEFSQLDYYSVSIELKCFYSNIIPNVSLRKLKLDKNQSSFFFFKLLTFEKTLNLLGTYLAPTGVLFSSLKFRLGLRSSIHRTERSSTIFYGYALICY